MNNEIDIAFPTPFEGHLLLIHPVSTLTSQYQAHHTSQRLYQYSRQTHHLNNNNYEITTMSSAEAQVAYNKGSFSEPLAAQEGFARQFDLSQPEQARSSYQRSVPLGFTICTLLLTGLQTHAPTHQATIPTSICIFTATIVRQRCRSGIINIGREQWLDQLRLDQVNCLVDWLKLETRYIAGRVRDLTVV